MAISFVLYDLEWTGLLALSRVTFSQVILIYVNDGNTLVVIKHQFSNAKPGGHGGQLLFLITFLVIKLYITGTMACLIKIWNGLLFFHMQREKLFPKVFNIFTVKHNSSLPEDVHCTKVWNRLYLALKS